MGWGPIFEGCDSGSSAPNLLVKSGGMTWSLRSTSSTSVKDKWLAMYKPLAMPTPLVKMDNINVPNVVKLRLP